MAGRGIANGSEGGRQKVDREPLRPLVWLIVHDADP
jgi:hypothetical protein